MWLGQKECGDKKDGVKKGGDIGFFESQKVVKVEDDDNQGTSFRRKHEVVFLLSLL